METKFKETKSTKPCNGCPFSRTHKACAADTNPEYPGGSHPFVYLGQARGPFWLACHMDKNYVGKGSDPGEVSQCRGAAIFRSNCETQYRRPEELLQLPEDKEKVFSNEAEFASHYLNDLSLEQAEQILTESNLDEIMRQEIYSSSPTKRILKWDGEQER